MGKLAETIIKSSEQLFFIPHVMLFVAPDGKFKMWYKISGAMNDLHKTSKGLRDMNYQDTQQFERATMLKLPIQPLLVLCGVMCRFLFTNLI